MVWCGVYVHKNRFSDVAQPHLQFYYSINKFIHSTSIPVQPHIMIIHSD